MSKELLGKAIEYITFDMLGGADPPRIEISPPEEHTKSISHLIDRFPYAQKDENERGEMLVDWEAIYNPFSCTIYLMDMGNEDSRRLFYGINVEELVECVFLHIFRKHPTSECVSGEHFMSYLFGNRAIADHTKNAAYVFWLSHIDTRDRLEDTYDQMVEEVARSTRVRPEREPSQYVGQLEGDRYIGR